MDERESSEHTNRKRTESIGGSSDSELSEGWNIIDQTEVINHDVPSSDGESIEVIDAEDESQGNDAEGDSQFSLVPENVVAETDRQGTTGTLQEEMFDCSFCWFLFFAAAAVLVSNLAFMVAESTFSWNTDVNLDAPSFLRDLPITPKLMDGDNRDQNIPWAGEEEVMVEVLSDHTIREHSGSKYDERSASYETNRENTFKHPTENHEKHKIEVNNKNPYVKFDKQPNERFDKRPNENHAKKQKENFFEHQDYQEHKHSLNFDIHELDRFFNALTEVSLSSYTNEKFNKILLILDDLYMDLNYLEKVDTETSELKSVLKGQKNKITHILSEMEYGISKYLSKVAINTLNKVHKLKQRFQNHWCQLENHGRVEKLKESLIVCKENEYKVQSDTKLDLKHLENNNKNQVDASGKIDMNWNNLLYQVDTDSPGKEHIITHSKETIEMDDYYLSVMGETQNMEVSNKKDTNRFYEFNNEEEIFSSIEENSKNEYDKIRKKSFEEKVEGGEIIYDTENQNYIKEKHYYDNGKHSFDKRKHDVKGNHYEDEGRYHNDRGKYYDEKGKHYDKQNEYYDGNGKYDDKKKQFEKKGKVSDRNNKNDRKAFSKDGKKSGTSENYKSTEKERNWDGKNKRERQTNKKSFAHDSEHEFIRKYFMESCEKGKYKLDSIYEKLKSSIDSKLRISKKKFDSLFMKYCGVKDNSFNWGKQFNRVNQKGDFNKKNNKNFFNKEVIQENGRDSNMIVLNVSVVPEEKTADQANDDNVITNNQARQWVLNYEESLGDNKSNITGDWFFKAGESRSKMRWSHRRSDWWFERASHRRTHPYSPKWSSGRWKNWYLRRAWARENLFRESPNYDWCDSSKKETVTVPNPGFNCR